MNDRCRLTVRVVAVHEDMAEGRSTPATAVGDRWLEGRGQPFVRFAELGPDWAPLERGWVESASFLLLEVRTPGAAVEVGLLLGPPPAAKRDMWPELRGQDPPGPTPCWVARYGCPVAAEPADPAAVWLRCRGGEAKVTIHLFPA